MISSLTKQESVAISYLRVTAMTFIVVCHFMQALASHWAWVFNIGVQIFLLISGFLYGHKHVDNWLNWYKKRFVRIYVPFFLFFVAVLPLYAVTDKISVKQIIVYVANLQGFFGGVKGLGHLWFLTAIALCYVITPILQWSKRWSTFLIWVVVFSAISIFLYFPCLGYESSWIILYSLGYYLANTTKITRLVLTLTMFMVLGWLLTNFSWVSMMDMHSAWSMALHCVGALLIISIGLFLFNVVRTVYIPRAIKVLDNYSFQIYIVHHMLILPPFGMLYVTGSMTFNLIFIFFYIVFYTLLLSVASETIVRLFTKI